MRATQRALGLFAGPGGWDVPGPGLGVVTDGVELEPVVVSTRTAAGLRTVHRQVRTYRLPDDHQYTGLTGSPPCRTFTPAGNGDGRRSIDIILDELDRVMGNADPQVEIGYHRFSDERTGLVLEPLRVIRDAHLMGRPFLWIALEQVPAALPVWQRYGGHLARMGYTVATGQVHAEQYGVPQTRTRAVLLARLGPAGVALPEPTHSRFHSNAPGQLDLGVKPWVTIRDALRFEGYGWQRSNYSRGMQHGGTAAERGRTVRMFDQPSVTVTGKGFQWVDAPAGSPVDHIVLGRTRTVREAAELQGFPAWWPWQGDLTQVSQQIGDAVPPPLARVLLEQVI